MLSGMICLPEGLLDHKPLVPRTADGLAKLEKAFGAQFSLVDGDRGEVVYQAPGQPSPVWGFQGELCRLVAARKTPECIVEEDPLLMLAIPLLSTADHGCVAVATFLTRALRPGEDLAAVARRLEMQPQQLSHWASRQAIWPPHALMRLAEMTVAAGVAAEQAERMQQETHSLSDHLATTYEEISLLHRLTQNLKLSRSDEELGRVALEWLSEVIPGEFLAIQFLPVDKERERRSPGHRARSESVLLTSVPDAISPQRFSQVMDFVRENALRRPLVVNAPVTSQSQWPFPDIRELVVVALAEGENLFGWLAAVNHAQGQQFGTTEASLLNSVAAILGIHSGNIDLYRRQADLMAGIVRALSSAIDAKDPYTCGHSDRVARISVMLAQELKVEAKSLDMIYLAGLLHDVGKIGTNDAVLRKPGKLTEAEYEHIKQHPVTGHRILMDIQKLDEVLPIVLHHHESWDGNGYPNRLRGEEIPFIARIVSVADAYDAMGSDRPYRKGLPDEKIDAVFHAGAGQQWDPQVVAAFFRIRGDLRALVERVEESGREFGEGRKELGVRS
jgi:putative nucleotidyltransferase with HDIG domain